MFKQKKTAIVIAAALALPGVAVAEDPQLAEPLAPPSAAAGEEAQLPISANITFTSDYVFRGLSQTNEKFAVQGGFDWESASTGIYIGTWASNVSWTRDLVNESSSAEIDAYLGWKKNWGDWAVDLGYMHFEYPGASIANSDEIYAVGGWKWFYLGYYSIVSEGYFSVQDAQGSDYTVLGAEYTFPMNLTVGGHYGATRLRGDDPNIAGPNSQADYDDYKIFVGYSDATYTGLDYELAWTDTDLKNSQIANNQVYFSITKNF